MAPILCNYFSIVIPTYNNVNLFERAINSVLRQNENDYEIIVSDDSTSNIIQLKCIELNNPKIHYIRHSGSTGAVSNWNSGIRHSTGEVIILMHHDEEFASANFLSNIRTNFEKADIIISNIKVRINDTEKKGRISNNLKRILLCFPSTLLMLNSIGPTACVAVRKSLLEYFEEHLCWIVDMEWYYRLLKRANHIKYLPENYIISNHGHSDQITANIDIYKKDREDKSYLRKKYSRRLSVRFAILMSKLLGIIRRMIR